LSTRSDSTPNLPPKPFLWSTCDRYMISRQSVNPIINQYVKYCCSYNYEHHAYKIVVLSHIIHNGIILSPSGSKVAQNVATICWFPLENETIGNRIYQQSPSVSKVATICWFPQPPGIKQCCKCMNTVTTVSWCACLLPCFH